MSTLSPSGSRAGHAAPGVFRSPPLSLLRPLTAAALSILTASCSGAIDQNAPIDPVAGQPQPPPGSKPGTPATTTPPRSMTTPPPGTTPPGGTTPATCAPMLPSRLVRTPSRHFGNSVAELLGLAYKPYLSSGGATHDTFDTADSKTVTGAMAFEINQIASKAAQDATAQLDKLLACAPGAEARACVQTFVERLTTRAFRRPATSEEVTALMKMYDAGKAADSTGRDGVAVVIEAVLQSPSFIYRTEIGAPDGKGTRRLDGYETAAQLASLFLESVPDDKLLDAAKAGRLGTNEGITAEVDRLMGDTKVRANLDQLLVRWLGAGNVTSTQKNATGFTATLKTSMLEETRLFLDNLLWKKPGGLKELLTSRTSYVNKELAAWYGVPQPAGADFVETQLPADQRSGVLTQGSVMATLASPSETSVVKRGLFITGRLYCQHFPPPPAGAVASKQAELDKLADERARSEYRMAQDTCGACHSGFDPFGIMFERYDETGKYRTDHAGKAINSSYTLKDLPGPDGTFDSIVPFAAQVANDAQLSGCMVNQMAGNLLARTISAAESCNLTSMADALKGGGSLTAMFRQLATSPALTVRKEDAAP